MDSSDVFKLRKEAGELQGSQKLEKLVNALKIANQLYYDEPYDEWIKKAFAWVLIDLCKYFIENQDIRQLNIYFQALKKINFPKEDEIIESQKKFLLPKIDINYLEVQKAEKLSANGKHYEALAIFKNLISQNTLTKLHHESYGWVIYRYLKAEESNLSLVEVKMSLIDYMNLENERPSILHSVILNFALSYSKTHNDFNFYKFFLLWNPINLRDEDLHNGDKDGKTIPSLISRICKEFVNTNAIFDIEEVLLNKVNLKKESVLDFFREAFFWNISNFHKEKKITELWNSFEQYNIHYSEYEPSKWHSKVLSLAERFMKENEEKRFLTFFKNWNPKKLRNEDWEETKKDEKTFKPLAVKAIKKVFEISKKQTSEHDLSWLIQYYDKAVHLFPNDKWLLREKALLHYKCNESELAIKIYKKLVLELANNYYVWQEFSDCIISNNSLKIGMLSKALSLEKNEDFLGDIRLGLAKILIDENLLEHSLVELETYKKHREMKDWKTSIQFEELHQKTSAVTLSLKDN